MREGVLSGFSCMHYRYYMAGATYGAVEGLAKGTYGIFTVKFCTVISILLEHPRGIIAD